MSGIVKYDIGYGKEEHLQLNNVRVSEVTDYW